MVSLNPYTETIGNGTMGEIAAGIVNMKARKTKKDKLEFDIAYSLL